MASNDSLPTRYYAAEAIVWCLGVFIAILRWVGVVPGQAIPILDIQLADPRLLPGVVASLLFAALIYFAFEWHSAPRESRRWYLAKARAAATVVGACGAMWLSYPLVTAGTPYEKISTGWYIAAMALGFLLGNSVSAILLAAGMIRSRDEARKKGLPRVAAVTRFVFVMYGTLSILCLFGCWALYQYSPLLTREICLGLVAAATLAVAILGEVDLRMRQDTEARRIPLRQRMGRLFQTNEAIDYWQLLNREAPAIVGQLKVNKDSTQREIRQAIEKELSGSVDFHAKGLEPLDFAFAPKNGDYSNHSPDNWQVRIRTTDRDSDRMRILVQPTDASTPPHEMELPIRQVEDQCNLYLAAHANEPPSAIRTILSYGINQVVISTLCSQASLYSLAMGGDEARLGARIKDGADVNEQVEFGWTPLLAAAAQGYKSILNTLLKAGANPDTANLKRFTPLMFGARYGNAEICSLLIDSRANLDLQDIAGYTALMVAIEHGHAHIANLLISKAADRTHKNLSGQTALDLAEKHGLGDIAKRLRSESE